MVKCLFQFLADMRMREIKFTSTARDLYATDASKSRDLSRIRGKYCYLRRKGLSFTLLNVLWFKN